MTVASSPKEKNGKASTAPKIEFDYSTLVGREIVLFTEQLKGQPVKSRVVMVADGCASLDRGGGYGMVDSLVNNQKVIVQFRYKGQLVSVDADLRRSNGGRCNIVLKDKITPLTRRKFRRVVLRTPVKSSVLPTMILKPNRLSRLRWIETCGQNFSSGGILLSLPGCLERGQHLLLNIELRDLDFPALVVGEVKFCYQSDKGRFDTGVEFVINEEKDKHFDAALLKNLPGVIFEYTAAMRLDLEKKLEAWMKESKRHEE